MEKRILVFIAFFVIFSISFANTEDKTKKKTIKKQKVTEDVVVTADLHKQETFQTCTPVNNINSDKLKKENPTNLIDILSNEAGVTVSQTGPGSVRPVIRGLYDERVLTLLNGIRLAEQFGGGNHSYSIEPLMLSKVEVVRGPSSVIYGTDAIGGVLNFFTKGFGNSQMGENEFSGSYHSADKGHAETIFYKLGSEQFNGFMNVVNKNYGNLQTPDGELKNSAVKGFFINTGLNYSKNDSDFSINYYGMEGDMGVPINPAAIDMGFKNNRYKRTQFVFNKYDISPILRGFQLTGAIQYKHRNMVIETPFDDISNKIYQININKSSKNLNSHVHLLLGEHLIVTGINLFDETSYSFTYEGFKDNSTNLVDKNKAKGVIPKASRTGVGIFIQDEVSLFDNIMFKTGLRLDKIKASAPYDEQFQYSGVSNTDSGFSGNMGLVYNLTSNFVVFGNLGTAFRAPSILERFFYGVHQDSVDIGNPNLKFEKGKNFDLGFRFRGNKIETQLSLFKNRVANYISSTFSGEIDSQTGLEIHTWENLNTVELTGGEFEFIYLINNYFMWTTTVSSVVGKDKSNNLYLSEIPPLKIFNSLKLNSISLKNGFILSGKINALTVLNQNKTGEFEDETPGYTVLNLLSEIKHKNITFSFAIKNITDKSYHDHLSRIRHMNEQQGRSLNLNLKYNF